MNRNATLDDESDSFKLSVKQSYRDTLRVIFERAVAAVIASKDINISHEALDYVTVLAELHLEQMIRRIHRLSSIQRRQEPSLVDLRMTMESVGLQIHDLEDQIGLHSQYTDALNRLQLDFNPEPLSKDEEAFFNTSIENVKRLVPSKKRPGEHVPKWMPAFPPDHTFMATPVYSERITDPRALREKLVEEGRLAEDALRRITGKVKIKDELAQEDEDEEEKEEDQELVEVELEQAEETTQLVEENYESDEEREETLEGEFEKDGVDEAPDVHQEDVTIDGEKITEMNGESINGIADIAKVEDSLVAQVDSSSKDGTNEHDIRSDTTGAMDSAVVPMLVTNDDGTPDVSLKAEGEPHSITAPTDDHQTPPVNEKPEIKTMGTDYNDQPSTEVAEVNNLEAVEAKLKKPISLKISFGKVRPVSESISPRTAGSPFPTVDTVAENTITNNASSIPLTSEAKTTKMTAAEISKFDPFGLKTSSRKFDVLGYVERRKRILEIRASKKRPKDAIYEEGVSSKVEKRHPSNYVNSDYDHDQHNQQPKSQPRTPWLESIQHEYEVAFASILRTQDTDTKAVLESEVVNCDSHKYVR
jgi:Transcription factor TFIID complex subunit 8 C-term